MSLDWTKIVERVALLREAGAPQAEHERLKKELATWSTEQKFSIEYTGFKNGPYPDVLRGTEDRKSLFVGDAKDCNHETCETQDTVTRIKGYFKEFSDLLTAGWAGGYLAIATNSEAAAMGWVGVLNKMASDVGIVGVVNGQKMKPNFKIHHRSSNTWIVYW